MGRGREAATSPAGTPPAPLGGRGPLHPGYPSEVEDDRPSLTCPAAAVPADPQCQPGPALQPAGSEPRGARNGPGDAGHRISALTRPRDPAARRPALPAPPEAPASPRAQAAGSPRHDLRPAPEVPPAASVSASTVGSPAPALHAHRKSRVRPRWRGWPRGEPGAVGVRWPFFAPVTARPHPAEALAPR